MRLKGVLLNLAIVVALGLVAWKTSSGWLQIAGAISGLLSVWLVARENIWNFPVGLVNVVLFFVMFVGARLYADATLQVFFFVLTAWGWYFWLAKRGTASVKPTERAGVRESIILGVITVIGTVAWGLLLTRVRDPFPYLDAFTAIVSVIAQYWLSKKVFENWVLWIGVDVLSIGMYIGKHLDLTAGLYAVFLGIAIMGYVTWKRGMSVDAGIGARQVHAPDQGAPASD